MISQPAYERAVNLAASLAWNFSGQDAEVSYQVAGQGSSNEVHEFLARLAVIEPRETGALPGTPGLLDPFLHGAGNNGEYNIVLTARPRGSLPTALWNCSYFVFLENEPGRVA
jgi:hypothetical protein